MQVQLGGEQGQALTGQDLIGEEEIHDSGRQTGQRILTGPDHPGAIDAGQHALVAQALNGGGGALARPVHPRVETVADLLEHVDQAVLLKRGEGFALRALVQAEQKTQVEGLEIDMAAIAGELGDEAREIRGHGQRRPEGGRPAP